MQPPAETLILSPDLICNFPISVNTTNTSRCTKDAVVAAKEFL